MKLRKLVEIIPGVVFLLRFMRRFLGNKRSYWQKRRHLVYYRKVVRLAKNYAPQAKSILDVGSFHTPYLRRFGWIREKVSLDVKPGNLKGIRVVQTDFLQWKPDKKYDVVLCLQVLEHLENPSRFAQKLLRCGRLVIISVPYRWTSNTYYRHIHDPIDEAKLQNWLGRSWNEAVIATEKNGVQRLIVVLEKNLKNKSRVSN